MATRAKMKESHNRQYDIIVIYIPGWPYPFRIGRTKAKAIVKNYQAIKRFANSK